jgi:outer membrane lipoprotein SlyB
MATDMKYYKDLLAGVAGANLGASMSKAVTGKGAGSIVAAGAGAMAAKKAIGKLGKKKKPSGSSGR